MLARGGDGVIADGVADMPSVQAEDALDPALTPATPNCLGNTRHDSLERHRGLAAGFAHLPDLEGVLDQPQLAERNGKLLVGLFGSRLP